MVAIEDTTPSSFTVIWDGVDNAVSYDVDLYKGGNLVSSTNTTEPTITYENLSYDTEYSVTIVTNADGVDYADSYESSSFVTDTDSL